MTIKYETIGIINFKNKCVSVTRDQHGKFYVDVNARVTQSRLNAKEIVRYLLHTMHEEINDRQ